MDENELTGKILDNWEQFNNGINAALQKLVYEVTGIYEEATTEEIKEVTDRPEIVRNCPFCNEWNDKGEHYDLAKHILEYHPYEGVKRYKKELSSIFYKPDEISPRYEYLYGAEDKVLCPFCEFESVERHLLKRHVRQEHGIVNEILMELE